VHLVIAPGDVLACFPPGRTDAFLSDATTIKNDLLPLDPIALVLEHLNGRRRLGFFLLDPLDQVAFSVLDIDVNSLVPVMAILEVCTAWGIPHAVEKSRAKGWHVWVFYSEPVDAAAVRALLRAVVAQAVPASAPWAGKIEIFPKQNQRGEAGYGSGIFLPWNGLSMREPIPRTVFVDPASEGWKAYKDQVGYVQSVPRLSAADLQRLLAEHALVVEPPSGEAPASTNGQPASSAAPKGTTSLPLPACMEFAFVHGVPLGHIADVGHLLARHFLRRGLPQQAVVDLLLEWDKRVRPAHDLAQAREKLTAGVRSAALHQYTGLACERLPDSLREICGEACVIERPREAPPQAAPEAEATPEPEAPIRHVSITEVLAKPPESLVITYVVPLWIPDDGITVLTAKPGVGKGKLIQDLLIARATGGNWLGLPVTPGPALFWSGEQGEREDSRVMQAFCRGRGLVAADFHHYFDLIPDPLLRFSHSTMRAHVLELAMKYPGLLIGIDSLRRAFAGEEVDSAAADAFYQTTLVPLLRAKAVPVILGHPPKTTAQQRVIPDENMLRGSGDWVAQVGSFLVLRPVDRRRQDTDTESAEAITLRLTQAKVRSGREAQPLLVRLEVTHDQSPLVTFRLHGEAAGALPDGAELSGAVKALALLFEDLKLVNRPKTIEYLATKQIGRTVAEKALTKLLALGVIRGPVPKDDLPPGQRRGHWYAFVQPLDLDVGVNTDPEDLDPPESEDEEP